MTGWMVKPRPLTKAQLRQEALYEHQQDEIAMLGDAHKPWHPLPCDVHTQRVRPHWIAAQDWERAKAQLKEILRRNPHHYDDLK